VVNEVALGQGFSPSPLVSSVSIIKAMLHTSLYLLVALTRRQMGEGRKPSKGNAFSEFGENSVGKFFHFLNNSS
jgi:hypothetical protein